MNENELAVVNLDELASRWQIPVERIMWFITDCEMDPTDEAAWVVANWTLWMAEKQKAFEDTLFPKRLQTEPESVSQLFPITPGRPESPKSTP